MAHTHTRSGSTGRGIGPSQRPLPDNTQLSQQTDSLATGDIRTRNPGKRAAAVPRLRVRSHRDRQLFMSITFPGAYDTLPFLSFRTVAIFLLLTHKEGFRYVTW